MCLCENGDLGVGQRPRISAEYCDVGTRELVCCGCEIGGRESTAGELSLRRVLL